MLVEAIGGMEGVEVVEVVPKNFSTRHPFFGRKFFWSKNFIVKFAKSFAWPRILFGRKKLLKYLLDGWRMQTPWPMLKKNTFSVGAAAYTIYGAAAYTKWCSSLYQRCSSLYVGGIENKANSVQLQMQLPTGTELGNSKQ